MAIAIMGPGHFTKCGHYIVLSGIETIDGKNYFDVVDPHRVNSNYSNDKNMIDSNKNDGFVKAAANIFTRECQEYWVFSLDGAATHNNSITNEKDQLIENKINLERLGYGRLRNSKGEITSEWDKQFNDAVNQFIADFGLKEKYDELGGNKKTQIYVWISQAVNGQISKIQADTGSQGTNNKTHKEVITLESIRKNYYLGIGDALVGATKDIFEFVSHPIDGVVGAAKGILFLNKVRSNPSCEEALILDKIIVDAVENFIDSNLNEKARVLGRVVGEIVIIIATDGVAKSIMGYLPEIANKIKNGERFERIVGSIRGSKRAAEAIAKLKYTLKYSIDELAFQIKKVVSLGDVTVVELGNGITYVIREADDVADVARPRYREVIEGIWKYSGKIADEVADFYLSKVASNTKVTGKFSGTSSEILRAELKDVGVTTPPYSNQAHHIIPEGETRFPSAVEARQILERYGVDINSASNGVFLPDAPNYPHAGSAAVHRGSHTEAYYKYVRDELVNANVQSADDVVDVLDNIRRNLLNGSITPNM